MDRATRALSLAEDSNANAVAIRRAVEKNRNDVEELHRSMEELRSDAEQVHTALNDRTTAFRLPGITTENNYTTFGTVSSTGGHLIIATFTGDSTRLVFGTLSIAKGTSPLFAVLPAGENEVRLANLRTSASVWIVGAKKMIE